MQLTQLTQLFIVHLLFYEICFWFVPLEKSLSYTCIKLLCDCYYFWHKKGQEEFEETKGIIRRRNSKTDRQYHVQNEKKYKCTKNDLQSKDRVTRIPLKTGGKRRCSGRVGMSYSTCDTCCVTLLICVNFRAGALQEPHLNSALHIYVEAGSARGTTPQFSAPHIIVDNHVVCTLHLTLATPLSFIHLKEVGKS